MTKPVGTFRPSKEVVLDARDLLAALQSPDIGGEDGRRQAIARYLAGGDGWRDASQALGGAFTALPGFQSAGGKDDGGINQQVSEYLQRGPHKSGSPG